MARSSDAGSVALDPLRGLLGKPRNELFQHHTVDDLLYAAFPGQQPSAAGVPELVSHREGPAVLPQLQRSEALAVLLGAPADAAGGWLASGRRRPGGSELAAAVPPTAPPRLAGG